MKINLKKTIKPGQCAAMRCTGVSTDNGLCVRHMDAEINSDEPASDPEAKTLSTAIMVSPETQQRVQTTLAQRSLEIQEMVETIPLFEITTNDDMAFANASLEEIKASAKTLEADRTSVTKPLNEALRGINAWFKPVAKLYEKAEVLWKEKIAAVLIEQKRVQDEALALVAEAPGEVATEVLAVAHGQELVEQPSNISIRTDWDFEITDESQIPRAFCTPDRAKIKAYVHAFREAAVVPGVRFFTTQIVGQRRSA